MRQVWKFPVVDQVNVIEAPFPAKFLHFAVQGGRPHVWLEVEPEAALTLVEFHIKGTGHDIHDGFEYRGTGFDDPFVWHLYERRSK